MDRQFRAIVHGHVQGVYYRASTVERARALGLSGSARNLPDGSVEVIARGKQAPLEQLIDFLKQGPPAAEVTRVDVDWEDGREVAPDFRVVY